MPQRIFQRRVAFFCLALLSISADTIAATTAMENQPVQNALASPSHPAVTIAKQMLGKPYRYGSASPERGFDCSGLVYYAFKHAGINVPRTSETLFRNAFPVEPSDMRQGDLLFFRIEGKVSHVGIYIDGDTFLHAPSSGKVVSYGSLSNPYWRDHLIQAGRLF